MQKNVNLNREVDTESTRSPSVGVWRARLLRLATEIIWVCLGWLLGQAELLFGTYPLGLALLCAAERHTLPILLGLLGAALGQMATPIAYFVTYLVAALVRVAARLLFEGRVSKERLRGEESARLPGVQETDELPTRRMLLRTLFQESLCLRMATGAVCALVVALYRIFEGGFQYYDLFAALFAVLVTPAAVLIYSQAERARPGWAFLHRVSRVLLLFSFVFAANSVLVIGLPLSPMLAFFCTLWMTEQRGSVEGAVAGGLLGIAYRPLYAPAFLLASLLYGVLRKNRRVGTAVGISMLAALSWSTYAGGAVGLLRLVPAYLLSASAFAVALRLSAVKGEKTPEDAEREALRLRMEESRHRDSNERFRGISEAFSSLSELFYNLSDRFRRPGTLDLRRVCDRSFDAFCTDCPNKTVCWGLEYAKTLQTVNGLISALHTKGRVSRELIPPAMQRRCESVSAILETVNRECARLTVEVLRNNRTEIFAMDYESAAEIINDALEEDAGEYRFDPESEARVAEYLADAGVRAQGVTVYGHRRCRIVVRGVDVENSRVSVETLRQDLGELCGLELGRPCFEVEDRVSTMILGAQKKIAVTGAQNNLSADGGVSGDSVNLFSNKKDYFYALISDGMGAGRDAAMTSNLCSAFLERMLRAGNRASTSIRMLNNLVRSRGQDATRECSSTVDLLELDLMTGEATFLKSGAAPSYVIRRGVVQRLQAGTVPIGILCAPDTQSSSYPLALGDTVVMISDGILQDDPDGVWLERFLQGAGEMMPEEIVYRICLHAAESAHHDDCSAIALRVQSAEE